MNFKLPSINNKKFHLLTLASIVSLVIAYYYYKYLLFLDHWKVVTLKNDTVCQRADLWAAPQDFAYLQDNVLIAGVDDKLSIHQLHQLETTPSGGLIAFDPNQFPSYQNVTMVGFPFDQGIRFYPHGIYLNRKNDMLYVINHAYKYGGERVEIFQMGFKQSKEGTFDGRQVVAAYVGFIKFDDIHMGILNDLVVIDDHIFISQFQPFPDSQNGREHGRLKSYERLAKFVIGGFTNIYRCPVVVNKPNSQNIVITNCEVFLNDGTEYNGVEWDGDKYLYVSDVMKWKVRRVELNQNRNKFLSIVDIDVGHGPDNVLLSPDKQKLWVGVLASRKEFLEFTKMARLGRKDEAKVSGGLVEIDLQTLKAEDVVIQRSLNCASVAIRDDNDWVYIGSWQDWAIGRCKVNDKSNK